MLKISPFDLGVLGDLAVQLYVFVSLCLCEASLWDSGKKYCIRLCTFGGILPRIRRIGISGGRTAAIRCTRVISVVAAEPAAMQKCQFSGFSPASRLSLRRINVQFVQ